jgi:hypothetical protein
VSREKREKFPLEIICEFPLFSFFLSAFSALSAVK